MLTDDEARELADLQQRQYAGATGSLNRAELRRLATLREARERVTVDHADAAESAEAGANVVDADTVGRTGAMRRASVRTRILVLAAACLGVLALAAGAFVLGTATRPDGLVSAEATALAQRIEAEQGWDPGSALFAGTVHRRDIFMGTRDGGASDCAVAVTGSRIGTPRCDSSRAFIELPDANAVSARGLTSGVAAVRGDDGQPMLLSTRVGRGSENIADDVPDLPEEQMLASAQRARASVAPVAGAEDAQLEPARATPAYVIWIYDSRCVVIDVLDTAPAEAVAKIDREGLRTRSLCLSEPTSDTATGVLEVDNSGSDGLLMILPVHITAELHGPGWTNLMFEDEASF